MSDLQIGAPYTLHLVGMVPIVAEFRGMDLRGASGWYDEKRFVFAVGEFVFIVPHLSFAEPPTRFVSQDCAPCGGTGAQPAPGGRTSACAECDGTGISRAP